MKQWYIAVDGGQTGPFGSTELSQKLATGTIGADDLVWTEGMAEWQPAGQVAELVRRTPAASSGRGASAGSPHVRPDPGPFRLIAKGFAITRRGPWRGAVVVSPLAVYFLKRKRPGVESAYDGDDTRTCALGELPRGVRSQLDAKGEASDRDVIVIPKESVSKVAFSAMEQVARIYAGPYVFNVNFSIFSAGSIRRFFTGNGWKLNTPLNPTMDYPFGRSMGQAEPEMVVPTSWASHLAYVFGVFVVIIIVVVVKVMARTAFRRS